MWCSPWIPLLVVGLVLFPTGPLAGREPASPPWDSSGPSSTVASGSHGITPQPLQLAVPLYIYPGAAWSTVQNNSSSVGLVVMNPDSGPGSSVDPNYVQAVDATQGAGVEVLGYVPTGYDEGGVSLSQAESWVADYYTWYGVDGIFFDEASNVCDAATVAFYSSLYNFTKAEPGQDLVILNPGTSTGACYGPISDVILSSETNYTDYLTQYAGAPWTSSYPSSHFWHVVYDVPNSAGLQEVLVLAHERGAGWVYATDLKEPNPYDALPAYWSTEVARTAPLEVAAPTIAPGPSIPVGTTATFTVQPSGGGWNYTYRWGGLPPGCTSENASVLVCAPSVAGDYAVNATVSSPDGYNVSSPGAPLTTTPTQQPLEIDARGPSGGPCGVGLGFNATASGGTPPYRWNWSFGDGHFSTLENPLHAYDDGGSYDVVATVADEAGGHNASELSVVVSAGTDCLSPLEATAGASGPTSGIAPLTVPLVSQPSGGLPPYRFTWDFGDGSPAAGTQNDSHTYAAAGNYTARVWVNDSNGGSANAAVAISVLSHYVPMTLKLSDQLLNETVACTPQPTLKGWNLSLSAEVANGDPPYQVVWSFGDGTPPGSGASVIHAFHGSGPWNVSAAATDATGASQSAYFLLRPPNVANACPGTGSGGGLPRTTVELLLATGVAVVALAVLGSTYLGRRKRRAPPRTTENELVSERASGPEGPKGPRPSDP